MKINLHDIPEEGKSFLYSHNNHSLKLALNDLLKDSHFETEFTIRPINNRDFEMIGFFKSHAPELCSRCGIDILLPVNEKIHEILIPSQSEDRKGKYSKPNHLHEAETGGPSTLEYPANMVLDITEYLHEVVALAIPYIPAPPEDENGDCVTCKVKVRGKLFSYNEEMPEEKPESPFTVLKNLKLN